MLTNTGVTSKDVWALAWLFPGCFQPTVSFEATSRGRVGIWFLESRLGKASGKQYMAFQSMCDTLYQTYNKECRTIMLEIQPCICSMNFWDMPG